MLLSRASIDFFKDEKGFMKSFVTATEYTTACSH